MEGLKPCPFCGGEGEVRNIKQIKQGKPLFSVVCIECGCSSRACKPFVTVGKWKENSQREAIEKTVRDWNRRANNPPQ